MPSRSWKTCCRKLPMQRPPLSQTFTTASAFGHWSLGNFGEAEKSLKASMELDDRHAFRLVNLYVQQRRHADALECVQRYQQGKLSDVRSSLATHAEILLRQLKGDFKLETMTGKLAKLNEGNKAADVASYRGSRLRHRVRPGREAGRFAQSLVQYCVEDAPSVSGPCTLPVACQSG